VFPFEEVGGIKWGVIEWWPPWNPVVPSCCCFQTTLRKQCRCSISAKAARDRAVKDKRDSGPYDVVLADARRSEQKAVAALNEHRKAHGR
jgi:hypothetical protein